jgi:hypothetical protein
MRQRFWAVAEFARIQYLTTNLSSGESSYIGGEAVARPVTFGEVFATVFRHLGIDAGPATLNDRPQYLVEDRA